MKSEKWVLRTLRKVLVGYDSHTIYPVYIKDQQKVIRVKDLRIFEDYEMKTSTKLPDYNNNKPTFQGFLTENNDETSEELSSTCVEGQKVISTKEMQSTSKTNARTEDARANPSTTHSNQRSSACTGQRPQDARANPSITHSDQKSSAHKGQRPQDARATSSTIYADQRSKDMTKSRSDHIVKLSTKAQEIMTQKAFHQDIPPTAEIEVENLVLSLTELLNNWDVKEDKEEPDTLVRENLEPKSQSSDEKDPIIILITKINSVNAANYNQFVCAAQFDIEESETYAGAM